MDRSFTHNGHGWVIPNESGDVAKCGGPAICQSCRKDAEQVFALHKAVFIDIIRQTPEYQDSLMNIKAQVLAVTDERNRKLFSCALQFTLENSTGVVLDPVQVFPGEWRDSSYTSWHLVFKDARGRLSITNVEPNDKLPHGTVLKVPSLG